MPNITPPPQPSHFASRHYAYADCHIADATPSRYIAGNIDITAAGHADAE